MREIKFRGFSKEMNKWCVGDLVSRPKPYIVGEMLESNEEYCNLEFWRPVEPESVGQFTGLKDKLGKEIYEGDICRIRSVDDEGQFVDDWKNCKIWFCKGQFITDYYGFPVHYFFREKSEIEVIGNIYEHPELLKEEEPCHG